MSARFRLMSRKRRDADVHLAKDETDGWNRRSRLSSRPGNPSLRAAIVSPARQRRPAAAQLGRDGDTAETQASILPSARPPPKVKRVFPRHANRSSCVLGSKTTADGEHARRLGRVRLSTVTRPSGGDTCSRLAGTSCQAIFLFK